MKKIKYVGKVARNVAGHLMQPGFTAIVPDETAEKLKASYGEELTVETFVNPKVQRFEKVDQEEAQKMVDSGEAEIPPEAVIAEGEEI